jgi:uncharacterized protein involved in exopolysaccharide biosynthesis
MAAFCSAEGASYDLPGDHETEIETARQQMRSRGPGGAPMAVDPQELEKIEVELRATRSAEAFQNGVIARNNGLLRSIPEAKSNLARIEREKESQKEFYDSLVNRHSQAEVSKQIEVQDKATNFRIVDPAVTPKTPVSPNRAKIILIRIVAGLASGFGILMALTSSNRPFDARRLRKWDSRSWRSFPVSGLKRKFRKS